MAAPDDLIRASLLPTTLRVGERVAAVLRIQNVSDSRCTNLIMEFEVPQALDFEDGSDRIERRLLKAGARYDHHISLTAREVGPCSIDFVNFSFLDSGTGRPQHYENRTIDIDVQPAPEPPVQREKPPSPAIMASETGVPDVFVSYRRRDSCAVENIARRLLDRGLEVWFDRWSLVPGEPTQQGLERALQSSRTVAVFIGTDAPDGWHEREMRAALDRQASDLSFRVIPVLLPQAAKPEGFIAANTWVDFGELDDASALEYLVAGILGRAPGAVTTLKTIDAAEQFRPSSGLHSSAQS